MCIPPLRRQRRQSKNQITPRAQREQVVFEIRQGFLVIV